MRHHDLREIDEPLADFSELADQIQKWTVEIGRNDTQIPGVAVVRRETTMESVSYLHGVGLCLIAQGAKQVTLGEDSYQYDAQHYLITSVGLPVVAQVVEASEEKPYLGMVIELDLRMIAQLLLESELPPPRIKQPDRGMGIGQMTRPLVSVCKRLLDLLDEPEDIPIVAPLVKRELSYRLLLGEQGERLRQIVTAGSHSHTISRVVSWLQENYSQPLRMDELAEQAGMSTTTFHQHFRSLTAMTPLQYQKWLRLNEARHLMLVERLDAASAAFKVGYESASQFSREYSRQFGAPPMRDIKQFGSMDAAGGRVMEV